MPRRDSIEKLPTELDVMSPELRQFVTTERDMVQALEEHNQGQIDLVRKLISRFVFLSFSESDHQRLQAKVGELRIPKRGIRRKQPLEGIQTIDFSGSVPKFSEAPDGARVQRDFTSMVARGTIGGEGVLQTLRTQSGTADSPGVEHLIRTKDRIIKAVLPGEYASSRNAPLVIVNNSAVGMSEESLELVGGMVAEITPENWDATAMMSPYHLLCATIDPVATYGDVVDRVFDADYAEQHRIGHEQLG